MRLAVGLTCWQDGNELIGAALASVASVADIVIVADGIVEGVIADGIPDTSGQIGHVIRAAVGQTPVVYEAKRWPSNSEKLTWLLEEARNAGAEWILFLAADEELRHPHLLPGFLDGCGRDCWPIPFYYHAKTRPEDASLCPSKLVRVSTWKRSVAGSNVLEAMDGTWYRVPEGCDAQTLEDAWYLLANEAIPYLDHHPERRPEGRREIRFVDYEMELEPLPHESETEPWPAMVLQPHPFLSGPRQSYRCDQCGARYRIRGVCRNVHPPATLVPELPDMVLSALVAADETQVADAAPVEGWYCDQCGKRFPLPGTCDGQPEGQHEPSELKPLGPAAVSSVAVVNDESTGAVTTEAAGEAAASVAGDEPADATSSSAAADEQGATADTVQTADAVAPTPSAEPSVLQKAKDALDRAAQAIADAASLVASKLEE